jgi:hypothetical protein
MERALDRLQASLSLQRTYSTSKAEQLVAVARTGLRRIDPHQGLRQ